MLEEDSASPGWASDPLSGLSVSSRQLVQRNTCAQISSPELWIRFFFPHPSNRLFWMSYSTVCFQQASRLASEHSRQTTYKRPDAHLEDSDKAWPFLSLYLLPWCLE